MHVNLVRCEALETTFDSIASGLVAALREAYDTACEHHDPGKGDNSKTFGYCLYHYAVHEIDNSPERKDGRLQVVSIDPTFRFKVGDFELACHKVPSGDIWESFPRNDGAVGEMVAASLWLKGFEPAEESALDLQNARRVVLAHQGGPEEGLIAAHICIPTRLNAGGQIEEWGYVKSLSDPADFGRAIPKDDVAKTPPESIDDVSVRRKRKSKSNDGE
jgi:hypothetical protein